MAEYQMIPLPPELSRGEYQFLQAQVAGERRLPFAVIYYAIAGEKQDYGLRLDLDKRVFLDHYDDPNQEALMTQAAPEIAAYVGKIQTQAK